MLSRRDACTTIEAARAATGLELWHGEGLSPQRALDAAAANALHADALALDRAADLALQRLQIGRERPLAAAGDFAPHAAQVFRLAAPGILIADCRLLAADFALPAHGLNLRKSEGKEEIN